MDELKTQEQKQNSAKKGVDLAHGSLATTLTSGESKTRTAKNGAVSDPYDVFNYYSDGLKGSYFGMLDNKRISEMTIGDIQKLSKAGSTLNISYRDGDKPVKRTGRLFAVGRFQLVPDTLKGAKASLKYSDSTVFSKAVQDECFSKYLITSQKGRGAIINYISGKASGQVALDAAARAAAQEWASVGIKPGTSAGNGTKGAANGLTTYYVGTQNRASISYNAICKALNEDRAAVASGGIAQRTVDDTPNVQPDAAVKADTKVDVKKVSDNAAPKYPLTVTADAEYVITGSGLNIRTVPSSDREDTKTGRTLAKPKKVTVIGYHVTNGTKWLAILDPKGVNSEGGRSYSWISGNYAALAPKTNNDNREGIQNGGSSASADSAVKGGSQTLTVKSGGILRLNIYTGKNNSVLKSLPKGIYVFNVSETDGGWKKITGYRSEGAKAVTNCNGWIRTGFMLGNFSLETLKADADRKGMDVSSVEKSAEYVAKYGMAQCPQSQCTRGTSMYLQLASYASGDTNISKEYAQSCKAHLFGSTNPMTKYNISGKIAGSYKRTPGTAITSGEKRRTKFINQINGMGLKDADFFTFQYDSSQHIVFKSNGGWYSDFQQGNPVGCGGESSKFETINYFKH